MYNHLKLTISVVKVVQRMLMKRSNKIFPFHIFRAYDIRGKVEQMDGEVIYAIAHALVQQYKTQGQSEIVIGYDARLSSPYFAKIIEDVFRTQNFKVKTLDCCSTPQMYFAARETQGNGIMVTASHNPISDNGIKWIVLFEPPCPDKIQQVAQDANQFIKNQKDPFKVQTELIFDVKKSQYNHVINLELCQSYQKAMLEDIQLKRPFKVVLDGLNGSAGACAALVLKKMGCEVIALRCQANGHFPDHAPDPSQSAHLGKMKQQIMLHQADLGIALDGDGDRVVLMDETGKIISADRLLSLFAQMCLQSHPGQEIVFDVKCSTMVGQIIKKMGGKPHMLRTGSSFLRQYLRKSKGRAVFGGEYAGHYVFNDGRGFGYDDGLYAALRVMEYLSEKPRQSLSQLMSAFPERFYTEDTYISTHNTNPQAVLQEIERRGNSCDAELSKIDGIRLDFKNGFGIIRASNTGEFFTVRFDADHPTHLNNIRQTFASMLSDRYPMIAQDILLAH